MLDRAGASLHPDNHKINLSTIRLLPAEGRQHPPLECNTTISPTVTQPLETTVLRKDQLLKVPKRNQMSQCAGACVNRLTMWDGK